MHTTRVATGECYLLAYDSVSIARGEWEVANDRCATVPTDYELLRTMPTPHGIRQHWQRGHGAASPSATPPICARSRKPRLPSSLVAWCSRWARRRKAVFRLT